MEKGNRHHLRAQKGLIEAQWTFLIILDAARFDSFEKLVAKLGFEGRLQKVWSIARHTPEWYLGIWNKHHPDIYLLSAHPWPFSDRTGYAHRNFGESRPLWKKDEKIDINISLKLARKYLSHVSLDRFMLHFIPPHQPFIGPKGLQLLHDIRLAPKLYGLYIGLRKYGRKHGYKRLRECYEESLELALKALQRNRDLFHGKVIITSDHAELIGEHNLYGHQWEYPELHEIPWFRWAI